MSFRVTRPQDVPTVPTPNGVVTWHPVRHHLAISAFGCNAYTGNAGDVVVELHDEDAHEELYVVLHGAARFTVDGEEFAAPQGTLVLVTPPSHRVAVATAPDTTVLAVGAEPGRAYEISEWERRWRAEAAPGASPS